MSNADDRYIVVLATSHDGRTRAAIYDWRDKRKAHRLARRYARGGWAAKVTRHADRAW